MGGHRPPCEERPRHPVISEVVRLPLVCEDVNEQLPLGSQPGGDLLEESSVVLHVLKHLDGNNSVKLATEFFVFVERNIS